MAESERTIEEIYTSIGEHIAENARLHEEISLLKKELAEVRGDVSNLQWRIDIANEPYC